jgi:DAK2 domain fusion protein YloV
MVAAAHAALKARVARINALNVYPVPDGDTGTNMLLTLESVLKETSKKIYPTPRDAATSGARAALMGARGNSGVILSQMLRGACDVLAKKDELDAETFTAAIEGARDRAYASMRAPVEGTMLTVIKDAAAAARSATKIGENIVGVVRAAASEAHASVRRTPELLATLRDAGVVDAGGLGVAVILDGLYSVVSGEKIELSEEDGAAADTPDLAAIAHGGEEAWGYCTEFMVVDFSGDAEEFEDHVHSSGKSVLVVSQSDLVKVHIHTQDPGSIISYGGSFGRLAGVKVDDMEAQVREREPDVSEAEIGVVVASRGAGNRKIFESMGAVVIEGGQGANPSAADFAEAVQKTGAKVVVLLPNNKNIVPTAEQVEGLVDATVHVVPTTSIAGGIAVMIGFDAEGEPDEVAEEMREIAASIRCAEITRAVRDAKVDGRDVTEGAFMGLVDGKLVSISHTVEEAALEVAQGIVADGTDVITLLGGEDMFEGTLGELADKVSALDAGVEVEVRHGGQPMYPLQMVAE